VQPRAEASTSAGLSVAESLQNAFHDAANKALPVVVEVDVTEVVRQNLSRGISPFDFFFGQTPGGQGQEFKREGLGSGVIVGRDKAKNTVYVLTNNHVAGNASKITVKLYDEREFEATVVGKDERVDLALISFTTKEEVPVAVLGDSDSLRVGDWVIAVGSPYGFQSSVTAGIVSALNRKAEANSGIAELTDYIQTDASINSGNSGGALLNLRGEVVGLNTWIASQSGGSIGIGFAIPINNAKTAIKDFVEKGKIVYGWLGVNPVDVDEQSLPGLAADLKIAGKTGSLAANVYKGSPAEKAGMLPGDYVIKAGGTAIESSQQLTQVIGRLAAGSDLSLTVIRQGVEKQLTVRIAERPADGETASTGYFPGLLAIPLTDALRSQVNAAKSVTGLLLAAVYEETAAATAGLRGGDVILEANGTKLQSAADFYRVINDTKTRELSFKVYRQGRETTIGFQK